MEYNGDDIKKRRSDIQSNVLKSFNTDIEKAVAQIGETREWADGLYKKVATGKWVKVTNGKEKDVAGSSMSKKLKEEIQTKQTEWERIKKEFEDSLETKYIKGTIQYKVFFERAWIDEIQKNQFIQKIREEQEDINDEIREIEKTIAIEKKAKREAKAGKKEYDETDIKDSIKEAQSLSISVGKEIPRTGNAKQILPQVTTDDYYLDTKTTFESILSKEETWQEIDKRWDDMKKSGKYDWHQSPKSSSEYLIDNKTGDVYRYSDHWGIVASCTWNITGENTNKRDIAKSNIKDFERKESGIYFNPEYRTKLVEAAKIVLPRLKKLVSENKSYYLTDKAKKAVLEAAEKIYHDLQYSANMSIDEVARIRKKYDSI